MINCISSAPLASRNVPNAESPFVPPATSTDAPAAQRGRGNEVIPYWRILLHPLPQKGEKAGYLLENILPGLPIAAVPNDFQQAIDAYRIKAEYSLSFADCFAVVTGHRESATIMTGDPEFKKIEHLAEIEWILP